MKHPQSPNAATTGHLFYTGRRSVLLGLATVAAAVPLQLGAQIPCEVPPERGTSTGKVVTPEAWGIRQRVDETKNLSTMLAWASANQHRVVWPDGGEYWLTQYSELGTATHIDWYCEGNCTLRSIKPEPTDDPEEDFFLRFDGATAGMRQIIASVDAGNLEIEVNSTADVVPGQLAVITTTKMIDTDHRGQARDGIVLEVSEVLSRTRVRLSDAMPFPIQIGRSEGRITARPSATRIEAKGLDLDVAQARHRIHFTSGAAAGSTAFVVNYDPESTILESHALNAAFPAGVAVGDTFVLERAATVLFSHPARVMIEGMTLTRTPQQVDDPDRETVGFRGLVTRRTNKAEVKRVTIENFSEFNFREEWCYSSDIRDLRLTGANRAFGGYDGTGYGLSIFQTSFGNYREISGHSCRRLLDLGGTQGVSWNNHVQGLRASGGGKTFSGELFWPGGEQLIEAAGSHGAAAGTLYEDIHGIDIVGLLHIRGLNETADGLHGAGRMQRMVLIQAGGSGFVGRNLRYDDGISELGRPVGRRNREAPLDWLDLRLQAVMEFRTDTYGRSRLSSLTNIIANGVQRCIFLGSGGGQTVDNFVYGNIVITTDNETGRHPSFRLFDGDIKPGQNVVALDAPVVLNDMHFPKDEILL